MPNRPCALVTGSSRGIGRGIALCLAQGGYDVVVNYAGNKEAAKETAKMLEAEGATAEIIQANVKLPEDRFLLIDETIKRMGRLDLLVNNAGIAPKVRADLLEMSGDSFHEVMTTNLEGPFFLTQYAAKRMIELRQNEIQTRGRIIFVSSVSAYTSSTNRGEYCLSKAGISMATQLFADRLAEEDILVYEIRPGIIATDMTSAVKEKYDKLIEEGLIPQKRWGSAEDIGKAARAIAEGLFDYSTGAVLEVSGGFQIHRL